MKKLLLGIVVIIVGLLLVGCKEKETIKELDYIDLLSEIDRLPTTDCVLKIDNFTISLDDVAIANLYSDGSIVIVAIEPLRKIIITEYESYKVVENESNIHRTSNN